MYRPAGERRNRSGPHHIISGVLVFSGTGDMATRRIPPIRATRSGVGFACSFPSCFLLWRRGHVAYQAALYIFSLRAWCIPCTYDPMVHTLRIPPCACVRACRSCGADTCGVPSLGTPSSRPKWAMHQNRQCYPGHFLPPLESRGGWGRGGFFLRSPAWPIDTDRGESGIVVTVTVTVVHAATILL